MMCCSVTPLFICWYCLEASLNQIIDFRLGAKNKKKLDRVMAPPSGEEVHASVGEKKVDFGSLYLRLFLDSLQERRETAGM